MPEFIYLCPEGHEREVEVRMLYSTAILCDCGLVMHRKPNVPMVNWGGLRPSHGELAPAIKRHIEDAPRKQDRIQAEVEAKK